MIALDEVGTVRLQPVEEAGVADQAVFHHLGIAVQYLAARQGGENGNIRKHQPRLMEGADQVLALRCVDAGIAADRAFDLGQQRSEERRVGDEWVSTIKSRVSK